MTILTRLLVSGVALLSLCVPPAIAAVLTVPDQYPTVQSAIAAAASGDSIRIRAGTYTESLSLSGKDLVLFGESGAEATVITTNSTARVFDIGQGVTSNTTLSDLTFYQGFATEGAGIRLLDGADPVIRRCRFTANRAWRDAGDSYGGGIFAAGGSSLEVEDCTFIENFAEMSYPHIETGGFGGAIYAGPGTLVVVRRSTFEGNYAGGFEGGPGGAVYLHSSANGVFEDCAFTQNTAGGGGGIFALGNVFIRRCRFAGNLAQGGGAVTCYGSNSLIQESVFFDNNAWLWEGAINAQGPTEIRSNTVAFNTTSGGGVGGIVVGSDAIIVENNIIVNNEGVGLACYGALAPGAVACNDVWENSGGNYDGNCPDTTGVEGNISLDPRFCDATSRDLTIRDDSPCAPGSGPCGLIGALGVGCMVLALGEDLSGGAPPRAIRLLPPQPNPGTLPVRLAFELPSPASIHLAIYDVCGRRVASLADGAFEAGWHELVWPDQIEAVPGLAGGVYFIALEAGGGHLETTRLILIH